MAADVLPLFGQVGRAIRRLRAVSLAMATIAAAALPFVLVYALSYRWLLTLVVAGYAASKIAQFLRTDRSLKQIRLEERFYRQQMDGSTLRRCVRRSAHLWDDSMTLRALRSILTRPLPRILSEEEKVLRIGRHYKRHFRRLEPRLLTASTLVPFAGLVWLLANLQPVDPPGWMSLSISVLLIACILEVIQVRTVLGLRSLRDQFVRALSKWTIRSIDEIEVTPRPTSYRHDLLYRADPVYSAGMGK